jgi:GTPase SAR1 family protein
MDMDTDTHMDMETYKVVLVGSPRSGKTSLVKLMLTGEVVANYEPTLGVEVHPIVHTYGGRLIRFNVWDCAGDTRYEGLGEGYYIQAQAAIVYGEDADEWEEGVRRSRGDIPIIRAERPNIPGSLAHAEGIFNDLARALRGPRGPSSNEKAMFEEGNAKRRRT